MIQHDDIAILQLGRFGERRKRDGPPPVGVDGLKRRTLRRRINEMSKVP